VTSAVAPQVNAVAIPDAVNVIATYPIAVVTSSAHAALAQTFVDYVTGSAGQATLKDYGFLPPPTP
jgi:molybdate transport system substrate-binding protein